MEVPAECRHVDDPADRRRPAEHRHGAGGQQLVREPREHRGIEEDQAGHVEVGVIPVGQVALPVEQQRRDGFGVALVPASLGSLGLARVTFRPIKGPCRTSDLTLVWKRDSRASTVRTFLEVVRKEYAGAGRRNG